MILRCLIRRALIRRRTGLSGYRLFVYEVYGDL